MDTIGTILGNAASAAADWGWAAYFAAVGCAALITAGYKRLVPAPATTKKGAR